MSLRRLPFFSLIATTKLLVAVLLVGPLGTLLLKAHCTRGLKVGVHHAHGLLLITAKLLATAAATFYNPVSFVKLTIPRVTHLVLKASGRGSLLPIAVLAKKTVTLLYGFVYVLPNRTNVVPLGTIAPIVNTPVVVCIVIGRHGVRCFG